MKFPTDFGERPCRDCGTIFKKANLVQERCTPCAKEAKKQTTLRWQANARKKKTT